MRWYLYHMFSVVQMQAVHYLLGRPLTQLNFVTGDTIGQGKIQRVWNTVDQDVVHL